MLNEGLATFDLISSKTCGWGVVVDLCLVYRDISHYIQCCGGLGEVYELRNALRVQ